MGNRYPRTSTSLFRFHDYICGFCSNHVDSILNDGIAQNGDAVSFSLRVVWCDSGKVECWGETGV